MSDFTVTRRIELEYQRLIRRLMLSSIPQRKPDVSFEQWIAELAAVSERRDVADAAAYVAGEMGRWVNVLNARTWREAATRAQRSSMLHRLLQREMAGPVGIALRRIVDENAAYISSIPRKVAQQLTGEIAEAQQAGARPEAIAKMMRHRFPQLTRTRINLIARTETMKASAALTQARAEHLGLPCYEWLTSEDTRVRPSHKNMEGVIVFYDDPPSPEALIGEKSTLGRGHGGTFPNCRCPQSPLLTLDDVKWPHRVHRNGRIMSMTRIAFRNLSGMKERTAA
jgi:SPP1 gp7 family putative phage head morphogenesis protein